MKKFFKALALVLALALVIGVVPAQATSAKVKAVKKLYVGGAQGKSADGKLTSSIKNKVAIYKLAGYTKATKEGHKFTAEVQKDNGIVKITKNYVVAQKLGKALVDIYVDGEKVGTTTINSKINATEDTLQLLCNGEAMPEEFVVAGKYTFTLPRVGKDSDERRLYINGELVADDKDAPRTYTHTFTKSEEGEVTFKFEAYQDAKLDGALVSKEIKAKVVPPKATGVAQTAWDTFVVNFDSDIEAGGYYSDVKAWETEQAGVANDVYYKVSGVKVPFSSVKKSSPKENVLTVKMYGAFNPGTEYFIDIAGKTFSFVAAGNEAKDVTALTIVTDKATVATTTTIKYKLLNSAGIDITDTALPGGTISFTGTPSSSSDYLDALGTVYFAAVGDSVEATATFTYYDPEDNYTAKTTTGKGVIVAIASAATELVSSEYSISKAAETWCNSGAGVHSLKMGDAAVLYGKVTLKTGSNDPVDYTIGEAMDEFNGAVLAVKVADEHYAMAQGVAGNGGENIEGVHQGRTSVLVYYVNSEGKAQILTSWPVDVVAARQPASISAVAKNENTSTAYLNQAVAADKLNVIVTVKDQYGDDYTFKADGTRYTVTLTERQGSATAATMSAVTVAGNTNQEIAFVSGTVFNGAPAGEKTVSYDVKLDGTALKTAVSFKVKAAAPNAGNTNVKFQPVVDRTAVDTSLKADQTYWNGVTGDVKVKLVRLVDNYYYGGTEDFRLVPGAPAASYNGATYGITPTGTAIVARVLRNGSNIVAGTGLVNGTDSTANTFGTATTNIDTFHKNVALTNNIGITAGAGTKVSTINFQVFNTGNKLATGTYQVSFFKVTKAAVADTTVTVVPLGTVGFTATDNQIGPTPVQKSQTTTTLINTAYSTTNAQVLAIVNANYEFWWKGNKYQATKVEYKQNGEQLYIYSVAVNVTANLYSYDIAETYEIPVTIGELITYVEP